MFSSKKHDGHLRQFIIHSQAWYGRSESAAVNAKSGEDEILIGFYNPNGGTSGEFAIRWRPLSNRIVPYLHAFHDSWSALANFTDVIQGLAELDSTTPSVETVAQMLRACGVRDATEREAPRKAPDPQVTRADVETTVRLLTVYSAMLERARTAGRELRGEPNWAEGLEFGPNILDGTKGVPPALLSDVMKAAEMVKTQRTVLRHLLNDLKDPQLTAQYQDLVTSPR